MTYTILITNRDLDVIGDPLSRWTDLDITLRFNEPDSGSLTIPADGVSAAQLAPGNRVVVVRNPVPAIGFPGDVVTAGPMEVPGEQSWSAESDPGAGTMKIAWASDLARVVGEVVYPDPLNELSEQTSVRRKFVEGPAETTMYQIVRESVGASALPYRRIPRLTLAAPAGIGTPVTTGFRMTPLGDALRSVASAGGGLGFRTRQVGTEIRFEVYQPRDLTAHVRFSRGLGNLLSYHYTPGAPTATVAIVGDGSGEGANRAWFHGVGSGAPAWGRYVTVVDRRDTADEREIWAAAEEALAAGAESAQLRATTIDTPTQRYGVHYGLGDRVSYELNTGVVLADIVREVTISATPDGGELVTATAGTASASTDPDYVRLLHQLITRLRRLEAV
ncbi:siphovirus ReqiPepy6 Gp37-like family protein [Micromonospora okii]|uniref:siphovirus ReqiPepy6 Gp37-like family protein n=1 Tax=Micromonospora okii TaxID=1182970 RepID=UPI001E4DABEC|nr:siphovirus ReqiPepy6 Gp37-like family protein [Micromonospora okii]